MSFSSEFSPYSESPRALWRPGVERRSSTRSAPPGEKKYWRRAGDLNDTLIPKSGPIGRRGEPISLAEVLAFERNRGIEQVTEQDFFARIDYPGAVAHLVDLQALSVPELIAEARRSYSSSDSASHDRRDLIFRLIRYRIREHGMMFATGTLEILPDGFGFLRVPECQYLSCPDDIYISPNQIRRLGLRPGCTVVGQVRPPKENERYFALLRVESVDGENPNRLASRPWFEEMVPEYPNCRMILESEIGGISSRLIDLLVPIGFGQRGLIVSPPRTGKTILLQKMAQSLLSNHPSAYVFMLLIDERPEEVTEIRRQLRSDRCEVVSSTFDENSSRHIQIAEIVLEKAKRMVECGRNVVIFLDSMTRLVRAWNSESHEEGKTLSGGLDSESLLAPKRFFGAARKISNGGSLTILATALVGTNSKMDDVIYEEFKGAGNLEIHLDPRLVEKRIWPAIDISKSGTRREEMLLSIEEYARVCLLRRHLAMMDPVDAMEALVSRMTAKRTNDEFLMSLGDLR